MKIQAFTITLYEKRARKLVCHVSLFLSTILLLTECSSNKVIEWREETRLCNGQIVVVERKAEYRSVYAGGTGNEWLFVRERIKATLLNREVTWEGTLQPLALDISGNGNVYLVAVVYSSLGQYEYDIPEGQYHAAFKFDNQSKWTRIPVETVPHEIQPNLLIDDAKLYIDKEESTSDLAPVFRIP